MTIAYIPEKQEPELMYKLFDKVCCSMDELVRCLNHIWLQDNGIALRPAIEQTEEEGQIPMAADDFNKKMLQDGV